MIFSISFKQSWLFVGISHPMKKSRGFCVNPRDFAKSPGMKIPKFRRNPETPKIPKFRKNPETPKIPNPEDKNTETKKSPESREFAKKSRVFSKNSEKIPMVRRNFKSFRPNFSGLFTRDLFGILEIFRSSPK